MGEHHGARRVGACALVAVLLAALFTAVGTLATPAPARAAGPGTLTITAVRDMVVDPGTGRVFVAGDDAVEVLAPDGTSIGKVPDIYGATALDAAGGFVWVTEANAGAFAKIDASTLAVVRTYTLGTTVGDSIAIVGNAAFVQTGATSLGRVDLTTGVLTPMAGVTRNRATRIPGTTAEVLVWSYYGATIQRVSTTAPFPVVTAGVVDNELRSVAFDTAGTALFAAGCCPSSFGEYGPSTLTTAGARYLADPSPRLATTSPGHGGVFAGYADGTADVVWTYRPDTYQPLGRLQLSTTGTSTGALAIGLSPDADTAYVLRGSLPPVVTVVDLHPAITAVSPTSVVRDVPTPVTITGRSLGATSSVTIGGLPAVVTAVGAEKVVVTPPAGVPTGVQPVVVSGPTGTTSTSITVQANTGATLLGGIRTGTTPVAGATLTLSGDSLATPVTLSSTSNGGYQVDGLPYGTTYRLAVHDPGGAPDQVIRNITLTPNQTTNLDVDLSRPPATGYELRRTTLGGSLVRDLLVEPTTGRIAVAVDDEVDVLDGDGALLARLTGLYDSRSLTRDGSDVYVGSARLDRITRIDISSLTITGSWQLGRVTTGIVGFAGGRVWFLDGDHGRSALASLDPTTGTVTPTDVTLYEPLLRSVDGDPDRFVASESLSTSPSHLFDASTATPVQLAAIDSYTDLAPSAPVVAVAAGDHLYDRHGDEFVLSTLHSDGVHYGIAGPPAHTPGHSGLVAFGSSVFRAGIPVATHTFPGGTTAATALDPSGTRLYRVQDDQLTVDDLAPTVTGSVPAPVTPLQTTFDLEGTGFGDATGVTIDGAPVTFTHKDPSHLTLAAPAPGLHRVVVTSSWGSSAPAPLMAVASTVPAAPTNVTATRVGAKVRVSWTAPTLDGGLPVTSYLVTALGGSGGSCASSTATTCDVGGLTPGKTYRFTVTAHNANGNSAPSAPSAPFFMALPTLPGAPSTVTAVAGVGSATISWSPPDDGGAAMTSTRINAFLDGTTPVLPAITVPAPATSVVYGGLTPGQSYTFTVASSNTVGEGPTSAPTAPVTILTPTGPPGPPGTPTAVAGSMEATVSWSPPTTTNGSPVSSYLVTASPGGRWCSTVTTSCTVSGLTNGRAHTFTVVAVNAVGDGPSSSPSAPVTPVAPGGSPFHPLPPARILDSRSDSQVGPYATPWATGQTRAVTVTGVGGVPAGATAVALNVTVTGTHSPGFATVWPVGLPQPVASSINWGGGDTLANAVTTRVGTEGEVEVFVAGGPVDVIFDVVGYYDDQPGDGLVPIAPQRILDSRPDSQVGPYGSAWGPGTSRSVTVAGIGGVPADAEAVVLNATVTGTTAAGFLTLSPSGQSRPLASTLNWAAGQTIPNAVTVKVGTGGAIDVFNNSGQAHVILDVAGYYTPGTGALFHPISPVRTQDSRPSSKVGPYATPWGPATSRSIVARDGTVVPDAAVAVLHNVTVTTTSAASYLSVWPGDEPMPLVSSLNWPAGRTTANQVTSSIGSTGGLWVYNSAGTADVITDVDGWFG